MVTKRNMKYFFLTVLFIMFSLNFINYNLDSNETLQIDYRNIQPAGVESYTENWLKNPNFTSQESWFPLEKGDTSDISANIDNNQGNLVIIGEEKTFSEISGIPLFSEWTRVNNPEFPLIPATALITSEGCYVSHVYAELAQQFPSVHWERNVSLPDDMSDYIIKSASLSAVVNGTVTASPGGFGVPPLGGGIECPGDATGSGSTQNYTWDYARFYILLSDLNKSKTYEAAYNQTVDLGKDSAGLIDTMPDTLMTPALEDDLIFFLTSVLSSDNHNFTITLGIRIWSEDNWYSDRDVWDELIIKSCNLTFTYHKKIDQFTAVSYNQIGNEISGLNTYIKAAKLNLNYKIDQNWPEQLSPNSEIKFLINNNTYRETIKLSTATTSFKSFKAEGIDITSLIQKDVNISFSVEISLADTFALDRNITISIDNIYLEISYTVVTPESSFEPWVFTTLLIIASLITTGVGGYIIAYQRVLKYPRPVRKVRKFKRTLDRSNAPDVVIMPRDVAFRKNYNRETAETSKLLKIKPSESKTGKDIEEAGVDKPTEKILEKKIDSDELISKSLEKKEELDKLIKETEK